jgi:exopolysaccharide biosynthesis polyprenyl glycosylphosphotransferase
VAGDSRLDIDMKWLVGVAVGFLSWIVVPLVLSEFADWCPRFGEWIVRGAARRLPREHQDRYSEEWLGELDAVPGKVSKLVFAVGILSRGRAISDALEGADRSARRQPEWRTTARKRYRNIALGLAVSDAVSLVMALAASYFLHYGSRPVTPIEVGAVLVAPLLWLGVFQAFSLYAPQHTSAPEEFRRVIGASGVGIVLLVMASYWLSSSFSRGWVWLSWMLALLLELAVRRSWRLYIHRLRMAGRLTYRTLVVGSPIDARRLMETLKAPGSGFKVLGYVEISPSSTRMRSDPLPIVGNIKQLRSLIQAYGADCLFVVSREVTVDDMSRITYAARLEGADVQMSVNLQQTLTSRLSVQLLGNEITLQLRPVRLTASQAAAKRAFDLVVASATLVLTLPLFLLIAVWIRLDSRGSVFFSQERVTKDGRVFQLHKFRTMRTGGVVPGDATQQFFKLEDNPRLTRAGAFLRRYGLDELPQLWNILVGDMSIVGPRPLPADQVAANLELLSARHEVRAGITGWWQINGRSGVTVEEAVRLDLFYIENWSLSLDLYILLKTFTAVVVTQRAF